MAHNDRRILMPPEEFERLSAEGTREDILSALSYYVRRPSGALRTPDYLRMRKYRARRLGMGLPSQPAPIDPHGDILDQPVQWDLLPVRIIRAFSNLSTPKRQFWTYRDLIAVSARELRAFTNVGTRSIDKLKEHLKPLGLKLRRGNR